MIPVEIKNLKKNFKAVTALKGVSFDVNEGELFGLIGPDGAGKTTLFRVMTSLMVPDSGTATMLGFDVVKDYKEIRKNVGYMPGRFSLYQDLTVLENLEFFATIFGTTIEENYDLIKDIYSQIEPFKQRLAGKLSGGMKQKLALSCALIHAPKILFLDEPTTGVDPVSRKEFWEMLKRLKKRDITMVVSTPYMDEASLCDRVALIQSGEILTIDSPTNISNSFEDQLISVSSRNKFKVIHDLRDFPYAASVFPFGETVHYTDSRGTISAEILDELRQYLIEKNHEDATVVVTGPTIEDVFMELMKKEQA